MAAVSALRYVILDTINEALSVKEVEWLVMKLWDESYKIVPLEEKDLEEPGSGAKKEPRCKTCQDKGVIISSLRNYLCPDCGGQSSI